MGSIGLRPMSPVLWSSVFLQVQAYLLATGEEQQGRIKTSKAAQLVISPTGTHVAAIDKNSLFVWAAGSITASGRAKPLNLSHTKAYTVSSCLFVLCVRRYCCSGHRFAVDAGSACSV